MIWNHTETVFGKWKDIDHSFWFYIFLTFIFLCSCSTWCTLPMDKCTKQLLNNCKVFMFLFYRIFFLKSQSHFANIKIHPYYLIFVLWCGFQFELLWEIDSAIQIAGKLCWCLFEVQQWISFEFCIVFVSVFITLFLCLVRKEHCQNVCYKSFSGQAWDLIVVKCYWTDYSQILHPPPWHKKISGVIVKKMWIGETIIAVGTDFILQSNTCTDFVIFALFF